MGEVRKPPKEQLLELLGKMSFEAEKVKAQIGALEKDKALSEEIQRICSSCVACGGCIANV